MIKVDRLRVKPDFLSTAHVVYRQMTLRELNTHGCPQHMTFRNVTPWQKIASLRVFIKCIFIDIRIFVLCRALQEKRSLCNFVLRGAVNYV